MHLHAHLLSLLSCTQAAYASSGTPRSGVLAPIAAATGPAVASLCTAKGAGIGGGTAGVPASFVVEAFDVQGRRVRDGGATVVVRVVPTGATAQTLANPAPESGLQPMTAISAESVLVRDAKDGSYHVSYTVPVRGDYAVAVTFDGVSISGSPFPVFFAGSATPLSLPALAAAPLLGVVGVPGAGTCKDFMNSRCFRSDCKFAHIAALGAATAMLPGNPTALVAKAHAAALLSAGMGGPGLATAGLPTSLLALPTTAAHVEELGRTLHVGNLSPLVTLEQLKQLFSYCGTVVECRIAGDSKQFAFLEFATGAEATQALGLNGMMMGDRPLRVEIAKTVRLVKPAAVAGQVPNAAVQAQFAIAQAAAARQAAAEAAARAAAISLRLAGGRDHSRELRRRSRSRSRRRSRSRSRERLRRRSRSSSRERRVRRKQPELRADQGAVVASTDAAPGGAAGSAAVLARPAQPLGQRDAPPEWD